MPAAPTAPTETVAGGERQQEQKRNFTFWNRNSAGANSNLPTRVACNAPRTVQSTILQFFCQLVYMPVSIAILLSVSLIHRETGATVFCLSTRPAPKSPASKGSATKDPTSKGQATIGPESERSWVLKVRMQKVRKKMSGGIRSVFVFFPKIGPEENAWSVFDFFPKCL